MRRTQGALLLVCMVAAFGSSATASIGQLGILSEVHGYSAGGHTPGPPARHRGVARGRCELPRATHIHRGWRHQGTPGCGVEAGTGQRPRRGDVGACQCLRWHHLCAAALRLRSLGYRSATIPGTIEVAQAREHPRGHARGPRQSAPRAGRSGAAQRRGQGHRRPRGLPAGGAVLRGRRGAPIGQLRNRLHPPGHQIPRRVLHVHRPGEGRPLDFEDPGRTRSSIPRDGRLRLPRRPMDVHRRFPGCARSTTTWVRELGIPADDRREAGHRTAALLIAAGRARRTPAPRPRGQRRVSLGVARHGGRLLNAVEPFGGEIERSVGADDGGGGR